MIDLTPLEVRQKKGDFPRTIRGYNADLVDDFLQLVSERLEELVRENRDLADRVERLQQRVEYYGDREDALTEALVTAQEVREEAERRAAKDAELLRREAEADAEEIRASAAQVREGEEETLRRLRARRGQLVERFRTFLERELAELAVMEEALELEPERSSAPRPEQQKHQVAGREGQGGS